MVQLCVKPPPKNPLEIDRPLIEALSQMEKILVTGGLVVFLVQVLAMTPRNDVWQPNVELVRGDIEFLLKEHLGCFDERH